MDTNVTYVKVEIGDMLLLVPTERECGMRMGNPILWSFKEFDFKVFGELDANIAISYLMKERANAGLPFYDIEMDMYSAETYSPIIEKLLKNIWNYVAMRQAYRYFDQLVLNFPDQIIIAFEVSIGGGNNARDKLSITPLYYGYKSLGFDTKIDIQFSSYNPYSETYIEELMVKIGKCTPLKKDYTDLAPTENAVISTPMIIGEHTIKKHNDFFYLRDGKIYCGLESVNPNILYESSWRHFTKELIHSKGCPHCNCSNDPGYRMEIGLPDRLNIFKHQIMKDYYANFYNDIYSVQTQFINIIHKQWDRIKKEHPDMERLVFQTKDNPKSAGFNEYFVLHYLDKNWQGPMKEIEFAHDKDYVLEEKEKIAKLL